MFWKNLSPDGGGKPEGELAAAIDDVLRRASTRFQTQLTEAAINVQGSGWGALTWEPLGQRLIVEQVYDHQSNVGQGGPPLLVLDMWEHAYYLQYQNGKADWVDAFWNIVELARRRVPLRQGPPDRPRPRHALTRAAISRRLQAVSRRLRRRR